MLEFAELTRIGLSFISAFTLTFIFILFISRFIRERKIFEELDLRLLHLKTTAAFGGIAIFIGYIFSFIFWSNEIQLVDFKFGLAALTMLLFVGMVDDFVGLVALKKLFVQITATLIFVWFADVRITHMHGIMGITEIPYVWSLAFTVFAIISITNAFNLIDGVDGLAGGIGVIIAGTLGVLSYRMGNMGGALLAFSLCGALLAFLRFNFNPASIYMGDTGAYQVGFVVAVLSIQLVEMSKTYIHTGEGMHSLTAAPAVVIGILVIPIFDTLRIFFIRLVKGQSPFISDHGHIHHLLIAKGFSHAQVCLFLYAANMLFIAMALLLQHIGILPLIGVMAGVAFLLTFLLFKMPDKIAA